MPSIPLPVGSYAFFEPRASCRRLVNCFSEQAPKDAPLDAKDSATPVLLRRGPGIVPWTHTTPIPTSTKTFHVTGMTLTITGGGITGIIQAYFTVTVAEILPPALSPGTVITLAGVNSTGTLVVNGNPYFINQVVSANSFQLNATQQVAGEGGTFNYTSGGTFSLPIIGSPASSGCRGLHMMEGVLYAVIGNNLYSVTSQGFMTPLGNNIPSTGLVRMADNGFCLVIIIPNTTIGYYYIPNTNVVLELENAPNVGDTTLTLAQNFPYLSGTYSFTFRDGEIRGGLATQGTLTTPSTNIVLTSALTGPGPFNTEVTITFPGSFAPISDPTFLDLGAIDCGFIDSYIVFLQANGKGFYNSDSTSISSNGPVTFTTGSQFIREFGTDLFVAMMIDHRTVTMLGQLSSEIFIDAGNPVGSPFSSAPNNFMQIGAISNLAVAQQDQSFFWIANDRTVRRQQGLTPVRVSNHGIENILELADLSGAFAFSYSIGGHLMVAFTLPSANRTLVYDCTTQQWHEMTSMVNPGQYGIWRVTAAINAYGKWIVGDSQSGILGYLTANGYTEFDGTNKPSTWIHQDIYSNHQRLRHKRLELVMGTGHPPFSPKTGSDQEALISMEVSDDGGLTFRHMRTLGMGLSGHYKDRVVWWRLGMARDRVYKFTISDPTELWLADAELDVLPATN